MKKLSILILFLALAFGARAQTKITVAVVITNGSVNGETFVCNGNTRTFTNNVFDTATQVLTNSDATGCGSKTNLLNQIYANQFAQVRPVDTGSNTFLLIGNAFLPMSVSLSPGLGTVSYSTQTVSSVIALTGPIASLPTAQARTNVSSAIVGGINAPENTNSIDDSSVAAQNLAGTNKSQTIFGATSMPNTNNRIFGLITSLAISGNSVLITNGVYFTPALSSPIMTNAINYGNAFSSPGAGANSEQFGASATASADESTAVGNQSIATGLSSSAFGQTATSSGFGSVAVGTGSQAVGSFSVAVGANAVATGANSSAFGINSTATTNGSMAFGVGAKSTFTNSTAIGFGASNSAPNQVMIGAPGIGAVVNNDFSVQGGSTVGGNSSVTGNSVVGGNFSPQGLTTNQTWTGTNTFADGAAILISRHAVSSLANGNNAAIPIGTNCVVEVSGPTGAFTINGIANGVAGKWIWIINQTGQQLTIANESGTDPTAANRIRTMIATDYITTNSVIQFYYSGAVSRWLMSNHNP